MGDLIPPGIVRANAEHARLATKVRELEAELAKLRAQLAAFEGYRLLQMVMADRLTAPANGPVLIPKHWPELRTSIEVPMQPPKRKWWHW